MKNKRVEILKSIKDNIKIKNNIALHSDIESIEPIYDLIEWVVEPGANIGGVIIDYKFGILNIDEKKLSVVVTNKLKTNGVNIVDLSTISL